MKENNTLMINEDTFKKTNFKGGHTGEIVDGTWTGERVARAKRVVENNLEEINSLIRGEKEEAR